MTDITPILKYPGAKWRIADWIIAHMPPHVGYVEPYFGSGAVFFNKAKSRIETINDLDKSVVRFFRVCRERPDELAYALSLTPWSREEFLLSDFCDEAEDDVESARQFAVRCWMTFGARMHCKMGWRSSKGGTKNYGPDNPAMWRRLPGMVQYVAMRLLDAQIENRPAIDVIKNHQGKQVLIYADPPYVKGTRTLNGDQYRHEMTDADHEILLSVLKEHSGMVMVSGYDCDMYNAALNDWFKVSVDTRAERGVARKEVLWLNPLAASRMPQMAWYGIDRMGKGRESNE